MQTHSPLKPTSTPAQPGGALAALETTRAALTHGLDALHNQILAQGTEGEVLRRQFDAANARGIELEARLGLLETEMAQTRFELQKREFDLEQERALWVEAQREREQARDENAGLNERLADAARAAHEANARADAVAGEVTQLSARKEHLEEHNALLQSQVTGFGERIGHLEGEVKELHSHKSGLQEQVEELHGHKTNLQGKVEELHGHKSDLQEQVAQLHEKNRELHHEVAGLYADLRSENLPELVLKLAAGLTGAESGLFTEADGDGTLAELRLSEMEETLVGALYDYSRRAANSEEPLVENDSKKLPDGAGLVNLAALPVAAKGKKRGVLLLCNKRSGPFTEDDTHILLAIGQHAGLAMENARLHLEVSEAYASTIAVLADAIEAKDAYTRGHCEGVSRLAVEVGRRLDLSAEQLEQVRYAALLHDVGKIGVPDGILLKPTKLMPEEFSIIQKHPQIGRDIVARVAALSTLADVILHHHEKWDGSGYPEGLAGEGIPLLSRIVCAVDAFDAMTTPRPYRTPVEHVEAIEEMRRCSGTQFDPRIVELVSDIVCAR